MPTITIRALLIVLLIASAQMAMAATGTVMPIPVFQGFDNNGNPISAGKLCSYTAGTTTPATTYSDVSLTVANANPVILDSSGRATVFLTPGQSYKFILKTAGSDATCATGSTVWTQDNIFAVPTSSANLDVLGTAGEAITAGQAVYLSDGSGGKNAGQWYKADNTNAYSSTVGPVGVAPNTITSGVAGSIRIDGQVTGLTSLTLGSTYYVGTTGSLTSTAPTNNIRVIGRADTTSSLVLSANPSTPPVTIADCAGRLTLTSGTPVTTTDVTAATTLYFSPYRGNRCALYDGTQWTLRTFAELSIAVPATTSQMYDAWLYDNSGTLALELLAWTNDTTRATALTTQDGVYVKTGVTTRRYLGSFRTTAVSGQTEDSFAKRYVWNYYNRMQRVVKITDTTASWSSTSSSTWVQAHAAAANQVDVVVGVAEEALDLTAYGLFNVGSAAYAGVGVGVDVTNANSAYGAFVQQVSTNNTLMPLSARYLAVPAVGRHTFAWLEYCSAASATFYGNNAGQAYEITGLNGLWRS